MDNHYYNPYYAVTNCGLMNLGPPRHTSFHDPGKKCSRRKRHSMVSAENRATIIDCVINQHLTMAEAGRRVQPNVLKSTVSSIIQKHRRDNSQHYPLLSKSKIFTEAQEESVCKIVMEDKSLTMKEVCGIIARNRDVFGNIDSVNVATVNRVLVKHDIYSKQLYKVAFDRNCSAVLEARNHFVRHLTTSAERHPERKVIYVDSAGFQVVTRTWRSGRSIIGNRISNWSSENLQEKKIITMRVALTEDGIVTQEPSLGPCNSVVHTLNFLDKLATEMLGDGQRVAKKNTDAWMAMSQAYTIVWHDVHYHSGPLVDAWFAMHPSVERIHMPPSSPFLNPVEDFFSSWRWKVFEHQTEKHQLVLCAMTDACAAITADNCKRWVRATHDYFPLCLTKSEICCAVDPTLWPDVSQRSDKVMATCVGGQDDASAGTSGEQLSE